MTQSAAKVAWTGEVDGRTVRILRMDPGDCVVQVFVKLTGPPGDDEWSAADDELSSHAYMAAFMHSDDARSHSRPSGDSWTDKVVRTLKARGLAPEEIETILRTWASEGDER